MLEIRTAVADDAPILTGLIKSAYRGAVGRRGWTREADLVAGERIDRAGVLSLICSDDSMMLVAIRGDRVVGCCHIQDRSGGLAYFGTFAVDPQVQGSGTGDALLHEAESAVQKRFGARVLEMTVLAPQLELIAYYLRRGYEPTGQTRPFPADPVFARPLCEDLYFVVLHKTLGDIGDAH